MSSIKIGLFGKNLAIMEWEHKAVAIEVSGGAGVGVRARAGQRRHRHRHCATLFGEHWVVMALDRM